MTDNTMPQPDVSALMGTLGAQQHLLQKLYNELDAEREASATAASEALSVIIRLQGEKAAVKMEAEQYKRLAEEKMFHAEESIAIIEDIIYQKEMEVASLDYQVQSYRYKLLKSGAPDPGEGDLTYPENLLQRGSESLIGGERESSSLGRRNSAPFLLKEHVGHPESFGNINSYAEEIRKLDIRVKEIAGCSYTSTTRSPPHSLSSRQSVGSLSLLSNSQPETRQSSPRPAGHGKNANSSYLSSPGVHDVFEVPQVDEVVAAHHSEAVKLSGSKDEPDWLKKLFQSTGNEINLCKPSHIAAIDRAVVQPAIISASESRPAVSMVNENLDVGDDEERVEESGSGSREEELKLLTEIKKQLDLLQDEIRSQKVEKTSESQREEPSLSPLPEAMLHFWL